MEEPEYRVYTPESGDEPVARDICGEKQLAKVLFALRKNYPQSTLIVTEVTETVLEVHLPVFEEEEE